MEATLFAFKRLHYCAHRILKRVIAQSVLTPDQRQRIVWMTEVGEDLLRRAYYAAVDTRVGEQMVKTAVAFAPPPELDDRTIQKGVF